MSTELIVNIAISAVVFLFIFFGVFWGLIRGFRRTFLRSLWILVPTICLVLFLSSVVTNALINMEFPTFTFNGVEVNSITDVVQVFVEEQEIDLTAVGESVDSIVKALLTYVGLLLNSIVFVLLFWIIKILLFPVSCILDKRVFLSKAERKYKKAQKEYKKQLKEYKKYRKGKPTVDALAFAAGDNDEILQEDLKEIKNNLGAIRKNSLLSARQKYDDSVILQNQLDKNVPRGRQELRVNDNELLNTPYVDKKEPEVVVEETFEPVEEYVPVEEKKEELRVEKPVKPKKPSKHRILGMLYGAVLGLLVCTITLTPVIGIFNIARDVNKKCVVVVDDDKKEGILDNLTDGMFSEINEYYEKSVGAQVLVYTGQEWVASTAFDLLTSGNLGEDKITLVEDVGNILAVVNNVNVLTEELDKAESNNYQYESLKIILDEADILVDNVFKVSIVNALTPAIIDIVSVLLEESLETTNQTQLRSGSESDTTDIIKAVVEALKSLKNADDLKLELKALIQVMRGLNYPTKVTINNIQEETSLLREILISSNSSEEEPTNLIYTLQKVNYEYYHENNNASYAKTIVGGMFEHNGRKPIITNTLLPSVVEFIVDELIKELEIKDLDSADISEDSSVVQTFLTDSLEELFNIVREINTYKGENGFEFRGYDTSDDLMAEVSNKLNTNIFTSLGRIIDVSLALFGSNSVSVVDMLGNEFAVIMEETLVELVGDEAGVCIAANIGSGIKTLAVAGEHAFENEFAVIGKIFSSLLSDEKSLLKQDGEEVSINNWEALPEVLKGLQETKTFGYVSTNNPQEKNMNNIVSVFYYLLENTKVSMIPDGLVLDEDGYVIVDEDGKVEMNDPEADKEFTVDYLLYDMVNSIQKNLVKGLVNGAYDWEKAFYEEDEVNNKLIFRNKMFNLIDAVSSANEEELFNFKNHYDSNEVWDPSINYDIFDLILDNSNTHNCVSPLDEMADSPLFKGVFAKMFEDFGYLAQDMIVSESDDVMSVHVGKMITEIIDVIAGTEAIANATYYDQISSLNKALDELLSSVELSSVELDSATLVKVGNFCDTLTRTNGSSPRLLSDETIKAMLIDIVEVEVLGVNLEEGEGSEAQEIVPENTNIASWIEDSKVSTPAVQFILGLTKDIDSLESNTNNRWKARFAVFGQIYQELSNFDNTQGGEEVDPIEKFSTILDLMSGKTSVIVGSGDDAQEYKAKLVTDNEAKKFIVGVVANNIGYSEDLTTNQIVYSGTFTISDDEVVMIEALDNISDYLVGYNGFEDKNNLVEPDWRDNYILGGVLANIANLDLDKNTLTWSNVCEALNEIIDMDFAGDIGNFSSSEANGGKYTMYEEGTAEVNGVEENLYTLLTSTHSIITLDQVKHLLLSNTEIDNEDYSAVQDQLQKNIKNMRPDNLKNGDDEYALIKDNFKALKYVQDIVNEIPSWSSESSYVEEVAKIGKYFDEINGFVLTKDLGKVCAKTIIGEALKDDTIADLIEETDVRVRSFVSGDAEDKYFLKDMDSALEDLYQSYNNEKIFGELASFETIMRGGLSIQDFDSFDALDEEVVRASLVEISEKLNDMQDNLIMGSVQARYVLINAVDELVEKLDGLVEDLNDGVSDNDKRGLYSETANYTSIKDYLIPRVKNNVNEKEIYVDENDSVPEEITINESNMNYLLVFIFDDFCSEFDDVIGNS